MSRPGRDAGLCRIDQYFRHAAVRVSAASEATLLAEITRLLDNALQARSRYRRLADRASRLYAPVVHATALLTILGWVIAGASWHDAIVTGIAVLIITCPCALGLGRKSWLFCGSDRGGDRAAVMYSRPIPRAA